MNMETAPKDGTRILIKTYTFAWKFYTGYERSGTQWVECWWNDGKWREWCGNEKTFCTSFIDPIEWCPLPDQLEADLNEARQLVIEANNSLYGSQNYFHSLDGGPFDKYHLAKGIEDLKTRVRKAERNGT